MDSLRKQYEIFGGWGWQLSCFVKVVLVFGVLDVDCDAETKLFNMYANIREGDMEREDTPGKVDRVAIVEAFKK